MQHRMKEFSLSKEEMKKMLEEALAGRISTINEDGYPYTVAVHFLYYKEKLYFHGLLKGQKLDNIARNSKVCFEVDYLDGILTDNLEMPCKADAKYTSVVVTGDAVLINEEQKKRDILDQIVKKYTPQLTGYELPEARVKGTAVVEIQPKEITGKYHR